MNTQSEQCHWLLEQMPEWYIELAYDYLSKQLATQRYMDNAVPGTITLEGWQAELQKVRAEAQKEVDWSLSADQAMYMLQMNNVLEAWQAGDKEAIKTVLDMAVSKEFTELFAPLSFDEACDRYHWMLEHGAKVTPAGIA